MTALPDHTPIGDGIIPERTENWRRIGEVAARLVADAIQARDEKRADAATDREHAR